MKVLYNTYLQSFIFSIAYVYQVPQTTTVMHIESSYNLTLCLLAYLFDQEGQQIFQNGGTHYVCIRQDILFRQITTFIKVRVAFDQTHQLIYSSKIYQLKGLKPKNKGRTNFYECCDLTEMYI